MLRIPVNHRVQFLSIEDIFVSSLYKITLIIFLDFFQNSKFFFTLDVYRIFQMFLTFLFTFKYHCNDLKLYWNKFKTKNKYPISAIFNPWNFQIKLSIIDKLLAPRYFCQKSVPEWLKNSKVGESRREYGTFCMLIQLESNDVKSKTGWMKKSVLQYKTSSIN